MEKVKKQNGMREGIDKKKIMKSMTDDDWKRVALLQKINENKNIKVGDDAYKCGVLCDQMVVRFQEIKDMVNNHLCSTLQSKRRIEENEKDILKGSTDQTLPSNNYKMTLRDLEIENMQHKKIISKSIREIRLGIFNINAFVGVHRFDNEILMTQEQFQDYVNNIKQELSKNGLDLYQD